MTYVCSWSGGKDSALALWRATRRLGPDATLLTMFTEDDSRSRAHGLRRDVLAAQAACMGLPLETASASWSDYTPVFVDSLRRLRDETGIGAAVFGDIDLEPHREWCQRVCAEVGIDCVHPLWGEPREALVRECINVGIEATVVAGQDGVLPAGLLGQALDAAMLDTLGALGVDAAGEQGEYHTVVTNGPMFVRPLVLRAGERVLRDGYWFLDLALAAN
jgi:diphthine-ammonia ligase